MADIDIGKILEALNSKADVDLNNAQKPIKVNGTLAISPSETEVRIQAGSTTENGALIALYGSNSTVTPNSFLVRAADGSKVMNLLGAASGSLKWNGYEVVRQQAGSLGSSGYIKLSTGLVMQWGITSSGAEIHTVSLPTSFSGGGTYQVMTTPFSNSGPFYDSSAYERTATYFKIRSAANAAGVQIQWFAIGY